TCSHCGITFARHTEIPFINRSDGRTFHLRLYSKPDSHPVSLRRIPPEHVNCIFAYTNGTDTEDRFVVVIMLGPREKIGHPEIEDVADKLAELLEAGKKPNTAYVVDPSQPF